MLNLKGLLKKMLPCLNSFENEFYANRTDGEELKRIADRLGLDFDTVLLLYDCFFDIDSDRSGYISSHEFLMYFDLERTPFALRVQCYDCNMCCLSDLCTGLHPT